MGNLSLIMDPVTGDYVNVTSHSGMNLENPTLAPDSTTIDRVKGDNSPVASD